MDDAIKRFFVRRMGVPNSVAQRAQLDTIRAADQARNSKIKAEFVVTFADVETRDAIKSYANGLASSKGEAGLRLDVPPCLKGSFKVLNEHGIAMVNIYGKGVKRSIKFDDRVEDLMMDIKLPTSETWHNLTIGQAREAKRARDALDMQNIRQSAISNGQVNVIDKEKARALMLAISPGKEGNNTNKPGVVHINSVEDWRQIEGDDDDQDSFEDSVEEILREKNAGSSGSSRTKRT